MSLPSANTDISGMFANCTTLNSLEGLFDAYSSSIDYNITDSDGDN